MDRFFKAVKTRVRGFTRRLVIVRQDQSNGSTASTVKGRNLYSSIFQDFNSKTNSLAVRASEVAHLGIQSPGG